MRSALACGAFGLMFFVAAGANAQQSWRNQLHPQSFDMWCQETAHLPPARCDKRLPEDDAAYQAHVNKNENYEQQQQKQNADQSRLDQAITKGDPSSNPAGTPPTAPIPPPR